MSELVLCETRAGVRHLTMNRPEKLNALNFALTEQLLAGLERAEQDADVRAVVLTGTGRGFCAGADTSEFAELTPANAGLVERRAALTARLHAVIPQMRTPVVAAVNGFAMGGGAGLALACDYVVASEEAVFSYPEIRHGIVAAIVMASLVKHVGRKRAFDLVATGRRVTAGEAREIGLATEVVAADALLARAADLATGFAERNPQAMGETKALLQTVADIPLVEGIAHGQRANARMRSFREGAQA